MNNDKQIIKDLTIKKSFNQLRNRYPKVIELFARSQFYRNNNLPTEINDMIEYYLLNLNSLNGKLCVTGKWLKVISAKEKSDRLQNNVLQMFSDFSLKDTEESKKKVDEAFTESLCKFWKTDKENFYTCKQIAFDSLNQSIN